MDKIIDYFKNNPNYCLTLVISLIVIIIIIALIVIFYKKSKSRNLNELQKVNENEENLLNFNNFSNSVDQTQPESEVFFTNSNNIEQLNEDIEEVKNVEEVKIVKKSDTNLTEQNVEEKIEEKVENKEVSSKKQPVKDKVKDKEKQNPPSKPAEINEPEQEQVSSRYNGKWLIYEDDGRYFADLKASNGEIMLRTETYSSISGVKSGIETLKKNIEAENFAISLDKNGNFVFKIFSTSKRLLCVGEGYSSREQCEKAFASVKRFSKTAKIIIYRENEED